MKNDGFTARHRTLEEQCFQQREQELIGKLRRRVEEDARRAQFAERTGVADLEILADLQALGFTAETLMLLHLLPLIQVAWADGNVSGGERQLILEAARSRGVEAGSSAYDQLEHWLTIRPSDAVFDKALKMIAAMLQVHPHEGDVSRRDLLSYCAVVAAASGGILGFGRVSEDERRLLSRITAELEQSHGPATARAVASLAERSVAS